MNLLEEQIIRAVAEGKVTKKTVAVARHYLEGRERRAGLAAAKACTTAPVAKQAIASVEHHEKQRRAEARVLEETSEATWTFCLERTYRDHKFRHACELCDGITAEQHLEPHHLEYGSGNRKQKERPENVMAVCRHCHDKFHARPVKFIEKVVAWCRAHLYPLPQRKEYRDVP